MPWIEASLRGQRVYARATADGEFVASGGRVEIRYKPKDGRAYRAALNNLEPVAAAKLFADDALGEAAPVEKKAAKGSTASGAKGPRADDERPAPASETAGPAWVAYTDGACSGNPGPAGSGLIVVAPDGKVAEGYEYLGRATNNVAELTAVLRALEALAAVPEAVVVHTDSKYAIGVLSKGWRPKANQELIARIKDAITRLARRVRFVYVPGHAGVPLNERADELAREAIRSGRSQVIRLAASRAQ